LGAKYLVVLCAGSTLLLVKQSLDEAPYKLSRAIAKLAGITFLSLAFSWIRLNLGFFLREKLAAVLIIPSSWGSQLDGEKPSTPCRIMLLIPSSRTPLLEPRNSQDLPLTPPKLLIFRESKEEALIYILTEAIYFPLSFA
jgi:hypothetical protein